MSTHPNVMLMAVLTPKGLARQTMKDIYAEAGAAWEGRDGDLKIGGDDYHTLVMESDYDEVFQVSAKEGDLVFFDLVTYGYGDVVAWDKLEAQKNTLAEWAKGVSERHNCEFRIDVSANYW